MACLPLIERELRVALRKQRPAQGRFKVAALAVGGSILFLWFGSIIGDRFVGHSLEKFLCFAGLMFVLRAPRLTADALAEERRNQTLGLLFLSGLSAGEVFASKFLSSALIAFTNLLAIFPLLALPFLLGGVSYPLFLAIICGLPGLMFFALSVSLLASVLTQEDGTAIMLANIIGGALCLVPVAVHMAQISFSPAGNFSDWWLCLSPAYGPYLVWRGFSSGFHTAEQARFWKNLTVTLGWTALAMSAAAFVLTRVWREREQEQGTRTRWRDFLHGDRESRQRLGRLWLDKNPFVWLAGRDRQTAMLGWALTGGIILIWLLCWSIWPRQWPSALNFMLTATLLNLMVTWLILMSAAQGIGQPRRDGAYELLLTTPLDPQAIVWGQLHVLHWQFRPLSNTIFSLNALMMLAGLVVRKWQAGAMVVYFSIWLFLMMWTWGLTRSWPRVMSVMWASLNCGRPAHAVWRGHNAHVAGPNYKFFYWIWIWNFFNFGNWSKGSQPFPSGSIMQVVMALIFTGVFVIVWLFRFFCRESAVEWDPQAKVWVRTPSFLWGEKGVQVDRTLCERLIREFREIVREPLPDPHDPRFKKWNPRERFPWGWELMQHQLVERLGRKSFDSGDLWKSRNQ